MRFWSVALLLALALLLVPRPATAAYLYIDDRSDPFIRVNVNDWEGGFYVNGTLIQIGTGAPAYTTYAEADQYNNPVVMSFSGTWIDLGAQSPMSGTIVFMENATDISDILTFSYGQSNGSMNTLSGTFVSDVDGGTALTFPTGPYTKIWTEQYDFSGAYASASADSSPEPGTWFLMATGLAAALLRRRK